MVPLRHLPSLLLLPSLLVAGCWGPADVVDGFHGYAWGTRASQIPEVALSGVTVERDGMLLYSAQLRFLGREVLGVFYFKEDGGGLVEGRYVLPVSLVECDAQWARVAEAIRSSFPTLRWTERVPGRSGPDADVYESDCEFFVYNAHLLEWEARLENPEPPGDAILLELESVGRSARIVVTYRGGAAMAGAGGSARRDPPG